MATYFDVVGKAIIVTGASAGIGAATARILHAAGARPVLAARRADRLRELSTELDGALALETDVTDRDQIKALVDATLDRHGRIDGLVNNAGVSLHRPLDAVDPDEFARVLDLNVVSLLAMTQAVLPAMRKQGEGRIINVGSGTVYRDPPGTGAYAATKAAMHMLSSVSRKEFAPDGIVVSLVVPSLTATEFNEGRNADGSRLRPGAVAHSSEYVAQFVLRAFRTGEATVVVPRGPERL